jgi:cobalt/nickel transport system permease protein
LRITIPVMMIGHLTFAGLAELIISGGVVAYLQRNDPSLLLLSETYARGARETGLTASRGKRRSLRPLWISLAALMILTPIGLLAAGTAWGEWKVADFNDPHKRQEIVAVSRNQAAPAGPPAGLARIASLWTAPMPAYAPPFLHSAAFGYVMSAMIGCGVIITVFLFAGWIARDRQDSSPEIESPEEMIEREL